MYESNDQRKIASGKIRLLLTLELEEQLWVLKEKLSVKSVAKGSQSLSDAATYFPLIHSLFSDQFFREVFAKKIPPDQSITPEESAWLGLY